MFDNDGFVLVDEGSVMTPEELACRDELIQAGLDPELATTIAKRQVALRKEKAAAVRLERTNALEAIVAGKKAGASLDIDYRNGPVTLPAWVRQALETSLAIEAESARDAGELGYLARALVIATLPYRPPKNSDGTPRYEYTRRSGNFTLRIVAGYEGGIPYGVQARLLLSWIASEAVRTKSPVIELGDSLREFLRNTLDIKSTSGGERSSATLVIDQLKRLFGSMVTAIYNSKGKEGNFALRNVLIANQLNLSEREMTALLTLKDSALNEIAGDILGALGEAPSPAKPEEMNLWTPQDSRSAGRWQSHVELSENFFEECIASPVPVDLRAYRALRGSPMAMDIYAWLTYRMSYLKRPSSPIPWEALFMQFGTGLKTNVNDPGQAVRDFKKAFLKALKHVAIVYPEAQLREEQNGLVLLPSPTHVPKVQSPQPKLSNDGPQGSLF